MTKDFALENPDLDPTHAISGVRFGFGIIDMGAQRVQWHTAFTILFDAGNFSTTQTTAAHDLDTFGAESHRRLHRALHGTAEGDTALELVGNALRHELGIDFWLADFDDVERHIRRRHLADRLAQRFNVRALFTDDNTGTRGIDRDAAQLGRTLDHHLRNRSLRQRFHDELADVQIFEQQPAIIGTFRIPAAVPCPVDLEPKPDRI